ncbi:MAG TPA: beta-galactosidase trimerization domain-containing protein, partial [Anaerolineales bacterium]|nr:beta-galactosidase trimerization domain-containing protein [Anaerolineales bacterium]
LGKDFSATQKLVAGSKIKAETAFLNCYDSRWSIQWQPHHKDFAYEDHFLHYYRPLAEQNIPMDILSADEPLAGYKLVIAPALLILNKQRITHLKEYVDSGGHLVLTVRCGMKDEFNALLPERQPGRLGELCGVEVEDYYALQNPIPVIGDGWMGESRIWAERIRILDSANTQVLATYGECNGWLDGHPAITRHSYGRGMVTFIGVYLDEMSQTRLVQATTQLAGVQPVMLTPVGVEACRRVSQIGEEIIIVINHLPTEQRVLLPWQAHEQLTSMAVDGELVLEPYGVAVLTHGS